MAISKNSEEKVILDIGINVDEAQTNVQKLEKDLDRIKELQEKLNQLKEIKLSADASVIGMINYEIEQTENAIAQLNSIAIAPSVDVSKIDSLDVNIIDIKDSIESVNSNTITPKVDDSNIANTVLSINEMKDLLQHLRTEQESTKDPLKLASLSKEAGELELKIRDLNEPFRDVNREIGELEDRMYALSSAGQAGTAEFNELLTKVSGLKQHVKDVDLAVDALSVDKFGQFISISEGMVQGFQGITGAISLMGIESSTAEQAIQKMMALQSIAQGLQAINNLKKQWTAMIATMKAGKVATETINTITTATDNATTSTKGLTVATKGQTVATTVSTVATKALSTALKAMGIGLIVSGLAMLITHFDDIKKYILKLFPALETLGKWFGKMTDAVTDFVGVTSDATRALDRFEKSMNSKNDSLKNQIELLKAQGANQATVYKKEVELIDNSIATLKEKARVNKQLTDDEKQQLKDLIQSRAIADATESKRISDEAKERQKEASDRAKERQKENDEKVAEAKKAYDEQLKTLKGYLKEAEKITYASNHNQRQVELKNLKEKYKEQIDLAKKLKKDVTELETAEKIERNNINKKYDDEYFSFIKNNGDAFLSSFAKEYMNATLEYNDAMKNATEEQKTDLENKLQNQQLYLSKVKQLKITMDEAEKDLSKAKLDNEIDEDDSFAIQKAKLDAQLQAETDYLNTQLNNVISTKQLENQEIERLYLEGQERLRQLMLDPTVNAFEISNLQAELNARLISIDENNKAIEDATTAHNEKLTKIEKDSATAKAKIDKEKKRSNEEYLKAGADALGNASDLFAEHTVAHKALSVSQATIDTYLSAVSAYKSLSGIPVVGPALGASASAIAVASGLASVKKILSVKVPNASDSSASTSIPSVAPVAPTINTTVLKSAENGNMELNQTMTQTNTAMENMNIKAYVVAEDIKTQQQADKFAETHSTI